MAIFDQAEIGHLRPLAWIFCLWKALLLFLAALSPGPGYDTSALILLDPSTKRRENFLTLSWLSRLGLNLLRWDALYFVKAAEHDKLFEQEWAFSWVYSRLIGGVTRTEVQHYVLVGILVSNVCHLLSVLILYRLLTITSGSRQRRQIAFVGAILHVLTPASLFLSAPYAEALFSLLNLTGMLLYAQSKSRADEQPPSLHEDALKLSSGILFAAATMMRSNGLLSGLILLYDAARYIPRIASMQLTLHDVRRIIVTVVAGCFIIPGTVWPQYLAYRRFCVGISTSETPPWCKKTIPSVYSWVQSRYWNVGLFRYWTLPNLPLFLMAAPMLWLLLQSSATVLHSSFQPPLRGRPVPQTRTTVKPEDLSTVATRVPELALPQLVLAVAATTSFHVQIVNRISSGYPTWYLMVATWLLCDRSTSNQSESRQRSEWAIRGIVVYAIAQGVLFANFLPPA
ncbi:GPI mannosyltransferase 2 [Paraphoma chrysanthemicola]|uniref:GPI mannosyltransferase 2 n=1 Tax=Paraphoma chrysanthemicola TaxID=798071 RepID=A0A8K0RFB8_9PLEO|nr:GPI mannosyltransferase 2 [Paraphoma chrysanthemicola]